MSWDFVVETMTIEKVVDWPGPGAPGSAVEEVNSEDLICRSVARIVVVVECYRPAGWTAAFLARTQHLALAVGRRLQAVVVAGDCSLAQDCYSEAGFGFVAWTHCYLEESG